MNEQTALKRLESEHGLPVQVGTRDQVRRAETAGLLFIDSDRSRDVMLLSEASAQPKAGTKITHSFLKACILS